MQLYVYLLKYVEPPLLLFVNAPINVSQPVLPFRIGQISRYVKIIISKVRCTEINSP
jgi:hypothetical protein